MVRKENRKTSAARFFIYSAAYTNRTAKPIYNSVRCPEAQPGALLSFCGEEWLEDMSSQISRDSATIVGERYSDAMNCRISPIGRVGGAQQRQKPDLPIKTSDSVSGKQDDCDPEETYLDQIASQLMPRYVSQGFSFSLGNHKMSILTHSQATRDRMKANSEAAKKRLARLNHEYQVREKVRQISKTKAKPIVESFGEAVARIARENQLTI